MRRVISHLERPILLAWGAVFLLGTAVCGAGLGMVKGWLDHSPPLEDFEAYNPPEATILYDMAGKSYATLFEQKRIVVDIRDLPAHVPDAFVAIEDRNFRDHIGVDPKGIVRAFVTNLSRRSAAQGASTITQQLARNLIARVGREKSVARKVREMFVALQMEHDYAKDQILEIYLNQIYLGSGAYGVESAARTFFGKPATQLNLAEAATLAGLPQLPEKYSPLNNAALAEKRRDQVLSRLREYGYIDDEEYDEGLGTRVEPTSGTLAGSVVAAYFVDAVQRELADDPVLAGMQLHRAGLSLRTTIDARAQSAAEAAIAERMPDLEEKFFLARQERFREAQGTPEYRQAPAKGRVRMGSVRRVFADSVTVETPGGWRGNLPIPRGAARYFTEEAGLAQGAGVDFVVTAADPGRKLFKGELLPRTHMQAAVVAIESHSGFVRALVGGRSFRDRANSGSYNRAWQARRQPGSTLKPLLFAIAVEHGLRPDHPVSDSPIRFGDGYSPRNYENKYLGHTTVQRALEKSANAATFRVVRSVGLAESLEHLRRFQRIGRQGWDLPKYWPVVLGSSEMTPIEVAGAYQILANSGVGRGPHLVTGVWNAEGRDTPVFDGRLDVPIVAPESAARVIQMMANVMRFGTGSSARELLPEELRPLVAGKTGTTDDNRDAWFAGFTPFETIVVWVGFDDPLPMGPGCTGGKMAGPIWASLARDLWLARSEEQRAAATLPLPEGWVAVTQEDGRALVMRESDMALSPATSLALAEAESSASSPPAPGELHPEDLPIPVVASYEDTPGGDN